MEKMRAAVVRRFGEPLEIEERPVPRPGPGILVGSPPAWDRRQLHRLRNLLDRSVARCHALNDSFRKIAACGTSPGYVPLFPNFRFLTLTSRRDQVRRTQTVSGFQLDNRPLPERTDDRIIAPPERQG